jgi:hypothetical protein
MITMPVLWMRENKYSFLFYSILLFKEVLRRENQGLKVYAVDRSLVFSMTGTYFLFILSLLSGLIFKKMSEAGTLFCCHFSCAKYHFKDSLLSGCVILRLKHFIRTGLAA